jgi:NADPH-dependent glutamate synthase beta subunit-like oxidoreductase
VTIRDSAAAAGGMMRYGIPRYRLPRDVLDAEVQRILDLGVVLELGTEVTDLAATLGEGSFDAAFLATGAQIGKRAYVPAGSAAHVLDAVSMLHGLEEGECPLLGRRVAVYGGGNTALDAARTATRLGAAEAVVVYRRTKDRMPAHETELREAAEEGVLFKWLTTVVAAEAGTLRIERMELDETGFPQPTGEFEGLEADSLVLALGQEADLSLLDALDDIEVRDGAVSVDQQMMTGHPGVFAGGDIVPYERSVTAAIGHGKRAAESIDAYLAGTVVAPRPTQELAAFAGLNTWYYADAPRTHRATLERVRRQSTFDEVVIGLDDETALFEARRCLSCGNCFSCDNCYSVCPDNAVLKIGSPGEKYLIDLDYCKGCGLCVSECPSGAIQMEPEEI